MPTSPRESGTRRSGGEVLVVVTLMIVGLLNVAPGVALIQPVRLESLYDVSGLDETETVLMRHRALLLGLVGLALLAAIRLKGLRVTALLGGLVSGAVFAVLTWGATTSDAVIRVALVDVAVLPLLVAALAVCLRNRWSGRPPGQRGRER